MARVTNGGVRYACAECRGHLVGLAPFEREHADGRRLWVASAEGAEAGTCPLCSGPLLAPAVVDGATVGGGLAFCRRCEQVWVPAEAEPALAPAATTERGGADPVRAHPDECPECGAPWAPDPAGRCRYCREQLAAGDQPVLIIERAGVADGLGSALGTALGIAARLGGSW
jgi:hypothetical protein